MLDQALLAFGLILQAAHSEGWGELALKFIPYALFLELPLFAFTLLGILKYAIRGLRPHRWRERYPSVTCAITCYGEGEDVKLTIRSLAHQLYPGPIEIIAVVDGALQNEATLAAARALCAQVNALPARRLVVLPKWQRGGRVSSLNAALHLASHEIVMALDGDTSFDNTMVASATRHFDDPNVVAVAGCLRARNARRSLAARLQGLEYVLSICAGKTGLSEFNLVNNISGAFGVFRAAFLKAIGGWDAGTAEDLDLTLRIKQYFGRHPGLRIVFDPHAVGHTDVPESFVGFLRQRLRWDGDLFYLYVRKFRRNFTPRLVGWPNFVFAVLPGLFMQVVMPFLIVAYTTWLFVSFDTGVVLGILMFVYLVYLAALAVQLLAHLLFISERPAQDLAYFAYLPLFPLFAMASRINSAFSLLAEMLMKSHLDSSMAPWWVLKRTKF